MNLEREKKIEKKNQIIVPVTEIATKSFGNYFQSIEHGSELVNCSIPLLLEKMGKSFAESLEVTLGGSAMEILSGLMTENEYWHQKEEMKKVNNELGIDENGGKRAKTVVSALKRLSSGDPDIDFYLPKKKNLREFFERFKNSFEEKIIIKKNENGGDTFIVKFSENTFLETYCGPIYEGSLFDRVEMQLKDKNMQALFHVDLTALPESEVDEKRNRRQKIGDIHDKCRGKYIRNINGNSYIEYNPKLIPKANEATKMNLEKNGKDPKTFLEIVLRELRKKTMHFDSINNSKRDIFDMSEIYPLLDVEDVFTLRELFFGKEKLGNEIYESQSLYQKEMIYQEFFLIVQKDPLFALVMLQDTGLDSLFFGRHFTRKELFKIAVSPHLNFATNNSNTDLKEKIKVSRMAYIEAGDRGEARYGLIALLKAIGQVFGEEKDLNMFDDNHLNKGIKILINPNQMSEQKQKIDIGQIDGEKKEIMEQLMFGGGLTERGLYYLLRKEYRSDDKEFRRKLIELKKENLIETANRYTVIDGKKVKARFYYPCVSSIRIEQILYDAEIHNSLQGKIINKTYTSAGISSLEAAIGISSKELREIDNEALLAFFHPIFLRYLTSIYKNNDKRPKTQRHIGRKK